MSRVLVRSTGFAVATIAAGAAVFGSAATANGAAHVAAAAPTPPATITAAAIRRQPNTAKVGTHVSSSNLSQRVFVSAQVGFALGAVGEAQYPAESIDGGASWKTFGPALHVDAAQAPLSVTEVGALNKRTVYFYGAGQVVDVTGDGGKQWWQAVGPELSLAVVPTFSGRLVWLVQDGVGTNGTNAVTWQYVSSNGGKVWHYTTALGGGV
jgi:hypothetical protein